jgi:hypothetical protein
LLLLLVLLLVPLLLWLVLLVPLLLWLVVPPCWSSRCVPTVRLCPALLTPTLILTLTLCTTVHHTLRSLLLLLTILQAALLPALIPFTLTLIEGLILLTQSLTALTLHPLTLVLFRHRRMRAPCPHTPHRHAAT